MVASEMRLYDRIGYDGHIMQNICGSSVVKKSNTTTAEKFLQYLKMTSDILYIYLA